VGLGKVWYGRVWFGLDILIDLVRLGLAWCGRARLGGVWFGLATQHDGDDIVCLCSKSLSRGMLF
jgi:hypothetical protein